MRTTRLAAAIAALGLGLVPTPGRAWKPYTHNFAGDRIRESIAADGKSVTILGRTAALRPEVGTAILAQPQAFDAGLVGPDGFPDLTYGQMVIHPRDSGLWLRYLLAQAWRAQSSPDHDAAEKQRILAFAYGFLAHAAGDVWGHTLVNDLAEGVFPSLGSLSTPAEAAPAVRHIIVEGVVNDATPGHDGNPDRGAAPGGDVSDDATPGHRYAVPVRFLYEVLVRDGAPTPVAAVRGHHVAARGPLVGEFLELRDGLRHYAGAGPSDLPAALAEYDEVLAGFREVEEQCLPSGCLAWLSSLFSTPQGCKDALARIPALLPHWDEELFAALLDDAAHELAQKALGAWLRHWAADIDDGLRRWPELGLATTSGLFDAQARRDLQNATCGKPALGPDAVAGARAACESGVSLSATVHDRAEPFIGDPGLRMLGLPDEVIRLREVLKLAEEELTAILFELGAPLAPLADDAVALRQRLHLLVNQAIADTLGVDIDELRRLLREPSALLCQQQVTFTFRGQQVTVPGFRSGAAETLDGYLGLTAASHLPSPAGPRCGRLDDAATYDWTRVGAVRNTVVLGQLALLDGPALNQLLGAISGRPVAAYCAGENLLTTALAGGEQWVRLIDGDHAWRADGAPVFPTRPPAETGGTGQFPLWEGTELRDAFRALFLDWENPWDSAGRRGSPGPNGGLFPDLGDPSTAALPRACPLALASHPLPQPRPAPKAGRPLRGRLVASQPPAPRPVLDRFDANGNGRLEPEEREAMERELRRRLGAVEGPPVRKAPRDLGPLRELGRKRLEAQRLSPAGGDDLSRRRDEQRRLLERLPRRAPPPRG